MQSLSQEGALFHIRRMPSVAWVQLAHVWLPYPADSVVLLLQINNAKKEKKIKKFQTKWLRMCG